MRLAAASDGGRLYVAAFWTDWDWESGDGFRELNFSSSANHGSGWTPGKTIAWGDISMRTELSGLALAAGRGGNVLVAYAVGYYLDTGYSYFVEVARSADHGASFLYGIADQGEGYGDSDPDIRIGPFGTAHLVYAKELNPGRAILYKYSFPPYGSWSAAPVRLDDDVAQAYVGAPRLALGACGQASILHATWREDLDLGDYSPSEILYTRKVAQPGYTWSEPLKIGDLNDRIYKNGLAAAGPKAFSVFAGRTSPEPQNKWGIAGSRVSSGVTCP